MVSATEVLTAIEIMTPDNPQGVSADLLWNNFFKTQSNTSDRVCATLSTLFRNGYVTRSKTRRNFHYLLSGKKYETKRKIKTPLVPPLVPPPDLPPLKNMELKDLRAILDKTIDALETIQDLIQPLLAKLLDLARDCDKLEQVRDIITGTKALVA